MIISLRELMTWTGLTIFELWSTFAAVLVSSVLLVIKLQPLYELSYWIVFAPLLLASICNFYFIFIVLIRSVIDYKDYKGPILRFAFNTFRQVMVTLFLILLCYKMEGDLNQNQVAVKSSYGVVFLPIWILMAGLAIQICRLF
ncbi:unnamed protein product [Caenorhabditis auriculariae]|uniref:Uncharacterized protein n=1 Tax=Caenorhabditis auriculariae TaxID=2777116 RepID=A0A8S1GRC1_9PELO|nr:unnamed protein product [Caenorhabditis auriculariae]